MKIKGHIPSSSDGCCVAQLSSFTSALILDGGFLMIAATQSVPAIKHGQSPKTAFEAPTFGI